MFEPNEFEWDAAKAASNLRKHGLAFNEAVLAFEDARRVEQDVSRPEDRESRLKVVARVHNRLVIVVFAVWGDVCRIISARRPNPKEERAYDYRSI